MYSSKFNSENKELFDIRKDDLDRIKEYLIDSDVLGINGSWGSGKTFLINKLKLDKDCKDYEFINIDLLSCNLDELQIILVNEIEKVLYKNRIYSKFSSKLKRFSKFNSVLDIAYNLVSERDGTYSKILENFRKEINKLNKTIIISYEDIDRIIDANIIKKIFSISEEIVCKKIKIIYQYDQIKLDNLGLNREYTEKYIPYIVNVTPISFKYILEKVFNQININPEILNIKEFKSLSILYRNTEYIRDIKLELPIETNYSNIRKVETFIKELKIALNENIKEKGNCFSENNINIKKIILNFFIIKHFFQEQYDKISLENRIIDDLNFSYKNKKYTIIDIKNEVEDLEYILSTKQNILRYILVDAFQYRTKIESKEDEYYNEKIDITILRLKYGGTKYTEYEKLTNDFIEKYFNVGKDFVQAKCEKCNENISNYLWHNGIENFASLVQIFRLTHLEDNNVWEHLIKLYFFYKPENIIDLETIEFLNFYNVRDKNIFLFILKRFNDMKIVNNIKELNQYIEFLRIYIRKIETFGYVLDKDNFKSENEKINTTDINYIEIKMDVINHGLLKIKRKIPIKEILEEVDIVLTFINKNREIINYNEVLPSTNQNQSNKTTYKIKIPDFNKKSIILDELQKLEGEPLDTRIQAVYDEGSIDVRDIYELYKKDEEDIFL